MPKDAPDWDDDRPTDIKMHGISTIGAPVAPADQTDEYPLLIQHDVPADQALPGFIDARLEVLSGPDQSGPFHLKTVRTVIGRGQGAHIRIHDTRLSKHHASILYAGSEFRIRDEKSTNGTFLNGSQVVEYAIRDGDKLLVGDSLFRFHITPVG